MIHLEYILMLMHFWIMISWTDFTRRYEKKLYMVIPLLNLLPQMIEMCYKSYWNYTQIF